ncbi:MAG TPA: fatty acid desaturase [Geminicoccaceae bacterium]|nr:fatty acid desaturase [Geminicoccaceae bacterium]
MVHDTNREQSWLRRAGPTWIVAGAIYLGWVLLTWHYHALPWWLVLAAGAYLLAWHGSLQHEAVHGQLAPWRWLNDAVALPPLGLWLPFPIYRSTHRAHHNFEILTEPWRDPESFYVDQGSWRRLNRPTRRLLWAHNTMLGRLLLGPALVIGQFYWAEIRALLRGDRRTLGIWLWHLPLVALVLVWVMAVCGIPLIAYLALFVLPGTSLTLVRSFAEHKAANTPLERTAIVEAGAPFALLFLNNNLHYAHHKRPDLPWHALPAYYRAHRGELLRENGGLLYRGYREILSRFFLRPVDRPVHPLF